MMCCVVTWASRHATAERTRLVDGGPAGQRPRRVGDGDTRACRVRGGEPHRHPRADRHRIPGRGDVPRRPDLIAEVGAGGAPLRLGPGELGLGEPAVGERAGRELGCLGAGDLGQQVERVASDTERRGGDAEGEQGEVREVGDRFVDVDVPDTRAHRERFGHDRLVDRDVERACAAQTDAVPRVVELDVGRREEADALGAVVTHRATHDPGAVLRAAPPLPATGDAVAVTIASPAPVRREHPAARRRHVRIDGAGDVGREEGRHRRRRRRDRSAPAGRAVAAGEFDHGVDHVDRRRTRASIRTRQAQGEQSGVGERCHGDRRQPSQSLCLVSSVTRHDGNLASPIDDVHPVIVGERRHARSSLESI